ncbi:MAG: Gfo/Idh/MocA family oxidoreductase, partial [Anaerolineae bacterium]|nr:Gfo/Idh/MocA family oxidoreductase [Anaerolineae bacterium]
MGISVAIVGLGQFGRHFVELYKKHPDVERLAICDLRADRVAEIAKKFAIEECYSSLDEVCKSDIEAVVIITQPWLHFAQVMQALEAGKHVYSAVPPVYGVEGDEILEQCDQLVEKVKRTGQIYMLGETTFFRRETMYCRQRAAQGDFGEFTYGECEYWHDLSHGLYQVAKNRWGDQWGPDKKGSIPMHYPTHSTSSMISIMGGRMVSVSARGYRYPQEEWFLKDSIFKNEYSNEVALYEMSNGALVRHMEFRRIGHPGREGFRLFGTEGCFLSDVSGARWTTKQGWEELDLSDVKEPLPEPLAEDLGGHGGSHA